MKNLSTKLEDYDSFILYSVTNEHLKKEGIDDVAARDFEVTSLRAAGIPIKPISGVYLGEKEASILVPKGRITLDYIFTLHRQDSVLELTRHKEGIYKAKAITNSGKETFVGFFREVPKSYAEKVDHSRDEATGTYYAIVSTDAEDIDTLYKLKLHS
jgi:hypothetical protein